MDRTITVSGVGRASIRPNVAVVTIGVAMTRVRLRDAQERAATTMTAVLEAVRAAGVREDDVQTSSLSLDAAYDYQKTPPRVTGYTVANQVRVTIDDVTRLSDVLDGAMGAGATAIDGITFRARDQRPAEQLARAAAIADARDRAEEIARAAGVRIVGVASIDEGEPGRIGVPTFRAMRMAAAEAATPVEPGVNEVTVEVRAAFLID